MTAARIKCSAAEIDLMKHALGWPKLYRNYFAADQGYEDERAWRGLIARGLAQEGRTINEPPNELIIFHVTDAGKAAVSAEDA